MASQAFRLATFEEGDRVVLRHRVTALRQAVRAAREAMKTGADAECFVALAVLVRVVDDALEEETEAA